MGLRGEARDLRRLEALSLAVGEDGGEWLEAVDCVGETEKVINKNTTEVK